MATPITISQINNVCYNGGFEQFNSNMELVQQFMDIIQTFPEDYDPSNPSEKWVLGLDSNCNLEWFRMCDFLPCSSL